MNSTIKDIRRPIEKEFEDYLALFNATLSHTEDPQKQVFDQIKSRAGKRLRPTLLLLMAKAVGAVNSSTLHAAVAIEMLHTASLVHDDVVDNSDERRGVASVNSANGNKVAVLLGDYILSTALLTMSSTGNNELVSVLAKVGQTLADGEILQLKKDTKLDLNYETYYKIIEGKTAALFETCCDAGVRTGCPLPHPALKSRNIESVESIEGIESIESIDNSTFKNREILIEKAKYFGRLLGLIFQIRDDIFDYLPTKDLGKPAAKDMREGKITLPALHILNVSREKNGDGNAEKLYKLALKVKDGSITDDEISWFIDYVVAHGGIEFAEKKMEEFAEKAHNLVQELTEKEEIRNSLHTIIDYFADRNK